MSSALADRNGVEELLFDKAHAIKYVLSMTSIAATQARAKLYKLIDSTADSHKPIQITGKRNNAVLISEEDWNAIQETLYLLFIPGMRKSIREGLKTPLKKCSKKLDW